MHYTFKLSSYFDKMPTAAFVVIAVAKVLLLLLFIYRTHQDSQIVENYSMCAKKKHPKIWKG